MDNRREEPNPAYEQYLRDIDNAPDGQATAYPEFDIFLGHVASPPHKLTVACAYGQEAGAIQIAVDAAIQDEDGEFAQAGIAEMTLGDFLDAFTKSLTSPKPQPVALGSDPNLPTVLPKPAETKTLDGIAVGDRVVYHQGDEQTRLGGQQGWVMEIDPTNDLLWVQYDDNSLTHGWDFVGNFMLARDFRRQMGDVRIEGSTAVAAQPAPVDQGRASAHDLVAADMQERKAFGLRKYGVTLQAHNGRDTLQDAYEEVLDLAVYLRTLIEERKG